jgi:hypothetical protein
VSGPRAGCRSAVRPPWPGPSCSPSDQVPDRPNAVIAAAVVSAAAGASKVITKAADRTQPAGMLKVIAQPRGNPSTRSPMMLRWISLVPPAIVYCRAPSTRCIQRGASGTVSVGVSRVA